MANAPESSPRGSNANTVPNPAMDSTPARRRSSRLSGILVQPLVVQTPLRTQIPEEDGPIEAEGDSDVRPATPENDGDNEEPSSVLASRIMRSQSNPSPPPSARNAESHLKRLPTALSASNDSLDTPSRPASTSIPDTQDNHTLPDSGPLFPAEDRPSSVDTQDDDNPFVDRASIQVETTPIPRIVLETPLPPSPMQEDTEMGFAGIEADHLLVVPPGMDGTTSDEEASVAAALVPSPITPQGNDQSSSLPLPSDANLPSPHNNQAPSSAPSEEEVRTSPLRRSTRPRKSVMPSPNIAPDPSPASRQSRGKRKSIAPTDPPATPQPYSHELVSPTRREMSPLREQIKKAREPRAKLPSLSPKSADLLGQIVAKTPSPLPPSEDPFEAPSTSSKPFRFPTTFPSLTDAVSQRPPMRSPKPRRRDESPSPSNGEPQRSPARRVPISEVTDRGRSSPTKHNPVHPLPNHTPMSSPARRPPPPLVQRDAEPATAVAPILRTPARRPTAVVDLNRPPMASPARTFDPPVRPPLDSVARASPTVEQTLPYPLKAATLPSSIPEEPDASTSAPSTSSMPPTSVLRHHTTPSKIPRLTPYSRPPSATRHTLLSDKSKLPIKKADTASWASTPAVPTGASTRLKTAQLERSARINGLKRKYEAVDIAPTTSTSVSGKPLSASTSKPLSSSSLSKPLSTLASKLMPVSFTKPSSPPMSQPEPQPVQTPNEHTVSSTAHEPMSVTSAPAALVPDPPDESSIPSHPTSELVQIDLEEGTPPPTTPSPPEIPEDSQVTVPPAAVSNRRTTRNRRPVFSVAPAPPIMAARTGRKPPATRVETVDFNQITKKNTKANERYLAADIETEVERRQGARPDSLLVKVKTVAQKEEDAKADDRRRRAERRAKAVDGNEEETNDEMQDAHTTPTSVRHVLGPGDEEEYVTPDRPPPMKRMRLDNEDGMEDVREARNVKWDKGLFTTVCMDEIDVQNIRRKKGKEAGKSCLAPAAKVAPLDKMGNLFTPSPLENVLVIEKVIVKKVVYDSDLPAPPPVEPAKNTRSRKKK